MGFSDIEPKNVRLLLVYWVSYLLILQKKIDKDWRPNSSAANGQILHEGLQKWRCAGRASTKSAPGPSMVANPLCPQIGFLQCALNLQREADFGGIWARGEVPWGRETMLKNCTEMDNVGWGGDRGRETSEKMSRQSRGRCKSLSMLSNI